MLGRTVEFLSVNCCAPIVGFDNVGIFWLISFALFDHLILKSAGGRFHVRLLGVVIKKFFAVGLVLLSYSLHFFLLLSHSVLLFLHHLLLKRLERLLQLLIAHGHWFIAKDVGYPLGERVLIQIQLQPLQRASDIDAYTVTDLVLVISKSRTGGGTG